MLIHSLLIPKDALNTVITTDTLETALHIMETSKQRCLPILDQSNTLYRGNIYKYHIYQHLARGGALTDSVTTLLKNATKFILNTDSFFTLFFTLNDLPYISVLNEKHHFLGIIKHTHVMAMLSQSWQITDSSFALTIELPENTSAFLNVVKTIKKYTDITNLVTLDRDKYSLRKRVIITLPTTFSKAQCDKLILHLQQKQFKVLEIENLTEGI